MRDHLSALLGEILARCFSAHVMARLRAFKPATPRIGGESCGLFEEGRGRVDAQCLARSSAACSNAFMKRSGIFLLLGLWVSSSNADQSVHFDKIWAEASAQIYPIEKEALFSESKRQELRTLAQNAESPKELAAILNPFLLSLGVSHTYLYQDHDPNYYMLRSLFTTQDLASPKLYHLGMQLEYSNDSYSVRTVLDGYPAARAGLRRGDRLLQVNGKAFHPFDSFNPPQKQIELTYLRGNRESKVRVKSVFESPHMSFWKATQSSVQLLSVDGKKIGYIHLWSGTNEKFLETLKAAVLKKFRDTDGLILDLRDGFGGAWWDYLDPFFADSSAYFKPTMVTKAGKGEEQAPPKRKNFSYYDKPMVVIINEGVRSGKEALAYQFKKTKRAKLIGSPTAGAFAMGKGVFTDEKENYLLYLSTGEILLDGTKIEGYPIQPDIYVQFPLDRSSSSDPQFEKASEVLMQAIVRHESLEEG
ncbi:MAG: S41 family peptidase [Bdellovibrionaceae bacterium]|nr:S41 family peptidase [Pseudobdellovibrionaceae bacterium]